MNKKLFLTLSAICTLILAGCGNRDSENQYTGVLEGTSVKVPALTGGQIVQLFVETGDQVERGEKMAEIDSLELTFQRQQLLAMLEDLRIQEDIARTDLKRTSQDLQYVQTKYDRIAELYKKESASKQNLDDIENQLNNLKSANKAAKQKILSLDAKRIQIQTQIKSLNKKIKDATIVSPASGIVSSKYFEEGEAIPPLSPIVEIINIRTLEIKIYISEQMLPKIKHGQPVTIMVDGLDKTMSGKVIWVSPKAEFTPKTIMTPETRTSLVYAVKISVENQDGILKDGMPVVVELGAIESD